MKPVILSSLAGLLIGGAWGWVERKPLVAGVPLPAAAVATVSVENPAPPAPVPAPALDEPGDEALFWLERIAAASRRDLLDLSRELFAGKPDFHTTSLLWERWVELDPEGGFRALMEGELVRENRSHQLWTYLGKWSAKDPDTAIARALTLPEIYNRETAFDRIARELAASRPSDFFRRYEELAKWGNTPYSLKTAATRLAREDPRGLAGLLDGSIPGLSIEAEEKTGAWEGLASGWARHDPQAAFAYFRQLKDPEDRTLALGEIAGRVIVQDQDLAAEIALEAGGRVILKKVAGALALTDPDAALAWLRKHFATESAGVAAQVAREHIPRSAAAAVDYLTRHAEVLFVRGGKTPGPFSRWTVDFSGWTVDDPQAALALADNISDPETRLEARSLFLGSLALRAPQEAIAQAAPGPERDRILNAAVETWARQDLTAASAWLAAEPVGAERDGAISGLLGVALRVEPESALPWAAAISDRSERINQLAWVLSRTNQRSPEDVSTALQHMTVSPEEITEVMKTMKSSYPPR